MWGPRSKKVKEYQHRLPLSIVRDFKKRRLFIAQTRIHRHHHFFLDFILISKCLKLEAVCLGIVVVSFLFPELVIPIVAVIFLMIASSSSSSLNI